MRRRPHSRPFVGSGLVVTTLRRPEDTGFHCRYGGVARGRPWPLDVTYPGDPWSPGTWSAEADPVGRLNEIRAGVYPLEVCADLQGALDYARLCAARGLRTRVLLCATTRSAPQLDAERFDELAQLGRLLGYDYASSSCNYSAVRGEMHPPHLPALRAAARGLNQFGLFGTAADLRQFLAARRRALAALDLYLPAEDPGRLVASPLETSADLLAFKVWRVGRADLEAVVAAPHRES